MNTLLFCLTAFACGVMLGWIAVASGGNTKLFMIAVAAVASALIAGMVIMWRTVRRYPEIAKTGLFPK